MPGHWWPPSPWGFVPPQDDGPTFWSIINARTGLHFHKIIRGFLIAVVLVPTLFTALTGAAALFGYRLVTARGGSMEPAVQSGDALWVRFEELPEVRAGDIATLRSPDEGWIAHRVVSVAPLQQGRYMVITKGDASPRTERWEIDGAQMIPVAVFRLPFVGYAVDFLGAAPVRILLVGVLGLLIVEPIPKLPGGTS